MRTFHERRQGESVGILYHSAFSSEVASIPEPGAQDCLSFVGSWQTAQPPICVPSELEIQGICRMPSLLCGCWGVNTGL